ncbi:MAG TPA: lysophospholipid acyltransferase family protein [Sphingobium sp.]|nr:lysophospholipid acyltransferase family protein [Sphingobium sp.]
MAHLRLLWRLALLLGLMAWHIPLHLIARRGGRHSPWPRRFLRRAARAIGIDVQATGAPALRQDVFFIANHLSWVDILVMGGTTGCAFIARDHVRTAPVIGWLAAQNGTIYVTPERGAVSQQVEAVRTAVATHQPVALFPEGRTGDGHALLPFKSALFAVLLPPPRAIRIQPVVLDYGPATALVVWPDGESGLTNARRILSAPGRRTVTLRLLAPFDPGAQPDRKTLAATVRDRISQALSPHAQDPAR